MCDLSLKDDGNSRQCGTIPSFPQSVVGCKPRTWGRCWTSALGTDQGVAAEPSGRSAATTIRCSLGGRPHTPRRVLGCDCLVPLPTSAPEALCSPLLKHQLPFLAPPGAGVCECQDARAGPQVVTTGAHQALPPRPSLPPSTRTACVSRCSV